MGLRTLLEDVKAVLEPDFPQRVVIWDYNILNMPVPTALVIKPGAMRTEIDAFGDQYLRTINVTIELFSYYPPMGGPGESTKNIVDAIDAIDNAVMKNYHLNKSVDEYQSARIAAIAPTSTRTVREGVHDWLTTAITLEVRMPDVPV